MIRDLQDPARPVEVGRWWTPAQNAGGGEDYPWVGYVAPRCHPPLRLGDRLYVSYWHHGFFILDISDIGNRVAISGLNTRPAHPHPTHTCLPLPTPVRGRRLMVLA